MPRKATRRSFLSGVGLGTSLALIGTTSAAAWRASTFGPNAALTPEVWLPVVEKPAIPTPTPVPVSLGTFGYGTNLFALSASSLVKELGFSYVKGYVSWADAEPSQGQYDFSAADGFISAMAQAGLTSVLRVDTPPSWAAAGTGDRPPNNPDDFGRFMGALASHLKGKVYGYEIWNEPNLPVEWGGQAADPARYTALLRAAYPQIKAADPSTFVCSAGLASTGGGGGAMNDCDFIQSMYNAGARGYFDVLGSHPYGFGTAPDVLNSNGITDFRRPEDQHQVMVQNGDGSKPIWATEFGYLLDPTYYGHPEYLNDPLWDGRQWQIQSPDQQAAYLVQAYQYAFANWPWMGLMLMFNVDLSWACSCTAQDPMRFYAITNQDESPRPAFTALSQMPKQVR